MRVAVRVTTAWHAASRSITRTLNFLIRLLIECVKFYLGDTHQAADARNRQRPRDRYKRYLDALHKIGPLQIHAVPNFHLNSLEQKMHRKTQDYERDGKKVFLKSSCTKKRSCSDGQCSL